MGKRLWQGLVIGGVAVGLTLAVFLTGPEKAKLPESKPTAALGESPSIGVPKQAAHVATREPEAPAADSQKPDEEPWDGGAFAPSLAGTQIDGALLADENRNLIVSLQVKDFYDYFLSTVGQRSLEDVLTELQRQIDSRLPPEAAREARRLLLDYVSYQEQLMSLMEQPLLPADQQNDEYYAQVMADTFNQLKQIRRQFFPPDVVDAFFSLEEAFGEYAVQTLKIRGDSSLSEAEKAERLSSLETLLPEQLVSDAKAGQQRNAVADTAREAFDAGIPDQEIRTLLQDVYTPEEVDSMLDFFYREQQWEERLSAYFKERERLSDSGLSGADKEVALQTLRQQRFEDFEQSRLVSEEAIYLREQPGS